MKKSSTISPSIVNRKTIESTVAAALRESSMAPNDQIEIKTMLARNRAYIADQVGDKVQWAVVVPMPEKGSPGMTEREELLASMLQGALQRHTKQRVVAIYARE